MQGDAPPLPTERTPWSARRWGRAAGGLRPEPLVAVLLWGGVYAAVKFGLEDLPLLGLTWLRVVLGAVLLVLLAGPPWRLPRGRGERVALVWATLVQVLFQVALLAGLGRTTASNSAILLATAPLLAALWFVLVRGRRPSGRHWLGLALGLAGVALVVDVTGVALTGARFSGDVLALAAGALWAWYGFAILPLVRAWGAARASAWTMALSAVVLAPVGLPSLLAQEWGAVGWAAWAGLAYSVLAGQVAAATLWARAVARHGPGPALVYAYLEPVSAVLIAWLLLGETLGLLQAAGATLALVGVIVSQGE